jgi:hypothetical protein
MYNPEDQQHCAARAIHISGPSTTSSNKLHASRVETESRGVHVIITDQGCLVRDSEHRQIVRLLRFCHCVVRVHHLRAVSPGQVNHFVGSVGFQVLINVGPHANVSTQMVRVIHCPGEMTE